MSGGRGSCTSEATGLPPGPRIEIVVRCPGTNRLLTVINGRYLLVRCTQKRCREAAETKYGKGTKVSHLADSITGRLVGAEFETTDGRVIRSWEEQHGRADDVR